MTKRQIVAFCAVLAFFLLSLLLKIGMSEGHFSLDLLNRVADGQEGAVFIFTHMRLPAIIAATVSAFLMVMATFILQTISKNDLADPSALGFQNIAVTVLALCYLYVPVARQMTYTQILFLSAVSVLLFSFAMYRFAMSGREEGQGNLLLLTGIGVNSFFQMLLTYMKTYKNEANDLLSILLQGNFDSLDLPLALGLSLFSAILLLLFTTQYSSYRLLQQNHDLSQSLGFNRTAAQIRLFALMSFAVATSLMFGSSFPFVAFTAIHAMRRYYHLHFGWHLITSSLFMAGIIMISDILAHQLFSIVIPTNVFLGLFSGLGFLIIYLQRRSHPW